MAMYSYFQQQLKTIKEKSHRCFALLQHQKALCLSILGCQTFPYIFRLYHLLGENYLLAICIISCLISILHKTPALMPHSLILPGAHLCLLTPLGTTRAHSSLVKGLIQIALITCQSASGLLEALCQTSVLIKMLTVSASPPGKT